MNEIEWRNIKNGKTEKIKKKPVCDIVSLLLRYRFLRITNEEKNDE